MNEVSQEQGGRLIRGSAKQGEIVHDKSNNQISLRLSESEFGQIIIDLLGNKQNLSLTINEFFTPPQVTSR